MMKKLEVKLSNERLITPSGLAIVGAVLRESDFAKCCNSKFLKSSQPAFIKVSDILTTYIGLLCQGKTAFDDVREFHEDPEAYQISLGINKIPSAEILRQRMNKIGDNLRNEILTANTFMFKKLGIKPTALPCGFVPVDIDVTPFDNSNTKKEGVGRTYAAYDGYAPIMAYIGSEGYLANTELREGKQHCQNHTPEFLRETLKLCHEITDKKLLIRMDSGNDASENLGILIEDRSHFIIKRNPRTESKEKWLQDVKSHCKNIITLREGKTVYIGSTWKDVKYKDGHGNEKSICMRMTYEIIERTIDKFGQALLSPEIETSFLWTNLGLTDEEIIQLYCDHGESEQYHSEIKTDMAVERLPSGKFSTNSLVLELVVIAFNILRIIGQESLKGDSPKTQKRSQVKRRRLRTVISNLILIAAHLTTHGRKLILSIGRSNFWRFAFIRLWKRFA